MSVLHIGSQSDTLAIPHEHAIHDMPSRSHTRLLRRGGLTLFILIAPSLPACANKDHTQRSDSAAASGRSISGRPRIAASVAEVHAEGGADQLEFFEELETRPLVSQDDALHAVLLFVRGSSAPTYVQRAAIAKQLGLMDPRSDQRPRDAVTVGEFSQFLAAALPESGGTVKLLNIDESVARLRELGLTPVRWEPNRGISGAELVGVLNAAERMTDRADVPVGAE